MSLKTSLPGLRDTACVSSHLATGMVEVDTDWDSVMGLVVSSGVLTS